MIQIAIGGHLLTKPLWKPQGLPTTYFSEISWLEHSFGAEIWWLRLLPATVLGLAISTLSR